MVFRARKYLGSIKVKNLYNLIGEEIEWGIKGPFSSRNNKHFTVRLSLDKTAITIVVFYSGMERLVKRYLDEFVKGSDLFLKKATIAIRKNKLEYVLLGKVVINPDKNRYTYTLNIEKGGIQMRKKLSLDYFENKFVRFYILPRERGELSLIGKIPIEIEYNRRKIYIFENNTEDMDDIVRLDDCVFIVKRKELIDKIKEML